MTRIAKLNDRFLTGDGISFAEFQSLLTAYGFRLARITGSHHVYGRDDLPDQPVVQPDGKDAKPYQVRQFRRIVVDRKLKMDDAL